MIIVITLLALIVMILIVQNPVIRVSCFIVLIIASVQSEARHDRETKEAAEAASRL